MFGSSLEWEGNHQDYAYVFLRAPCYAFSIMGPQNPFASHQGPFLRHKALRFSTKKHSSSFQFHSRSSERGICSLAGVASQKIVGGGDSHSALRDPVPMLHAGHLRSGHQCCCRREFGVAVSGS